MDIDTLHTLMRLSDTERRALVHALQDIPHPVYLFGSRVDDTKRGGDIDLAIFARGMDPAQRFALAIEVAARFRLLCDEKIDVQVFDTTSPSLSERCFLATIDRQRLDIRQLAA